MTHYVQLQDLSPAFSYPASLADTLHSYNTSDNLINNDAALKDDKNPITRVPRLSSTTLASKWSAAQEKVDSNWTLESVCIAISAICFVALAAIFASYSGKALTSWTFYFSLNTVASTLGTIGKSTLLLAVSAAIGQGKWLWFYDKQRPLIEFDTFDEASRGPLGSVKLLWRTKAR
jgi:hypothetical protein